MNFKKIEPTFAKPVRVVRVVVINLRLKELCFGSLTTPFKFTDP